MLVKQPCLIFLCMRVRGVVELDLWHLEWDELRYHLPKNFFLSAVKSTGKDLFEQSLPKLMEVASKKKSFKRAAKSALKKLVKKHIGGRSRRKSKKKNTRRKGKLLRSQSDLLFEVKSVPNNLPVEANHSSLDLFKKTSSLVTFDTSFEQKVGPLYVPNGPTLESELVDSRTNFIDLLNI